MKSTRSNRVPRCSGRAESGNMFIEMSLVMVVVMFSILGIFELGRAMWTYTTLASATEKAARFAIVHGARCADASTSCPVGVGTIAITLLQAGIGLDESQLQVTMNAGDSSVACAPASTCLNNGSVWPPSPDNAVGAPVTIQTQYPFQFALAELWPGQPLHPWTFTAKSTEVIQF